jgi:hypothetical protein
VLTSSPGLDVEAQSFFPLHDPYELRVLRGREEWLGGECGEDRGDF